MKGCIVPNATAKSPVWVYFGFPGNADGAVVTKKLHHIAIKQYILQYLKVQ